MPLDLSADTARGLSCTIDRALQEYFGDEPNLKNISGDGSGTGDNYGAFVNANTVGRSIQLSGGTFRIATSIGLIVPMEILWDATILIDGCTLTFYNDVRAPMKQVFTYANGGKVIFARKPWCPVEWWGGNGLLSSVDNYPPIMSGLAACKNLTLQRGQYWANTRPFVQDSEFLLGMGETVTELVVTGASGDGVVLGSALGYTPGNMASYISNPRIAGMKISRNVNPNSPSNAYDVTAPASLRIQGVNGFSATDLILQDGAIGCVIGPTNGGFMNKINADRIAGSGTDKFIGFLFDGLSTSGSTGSPNSSLRVMNLIANDKTANGINSRGYVSSGHYADLFLYGTESSFCLIGHEIFGAGASDRYCVDTHIHAPVHDRFRAAGLFIHDIKNFGQINIYGGNAAPDANASNPQGVFINNARGVSISGNFQVSGANHSNCIGLGINDSDGIEASMSLQDCAQPVKCYGVGVSKLSGLIHNNTRSGTDAVFVASSAASNSHHNIFEFSIKSSSGSPAFQHGYTQDQFASKNEYRCTMIEPGAVSVSKLNDNGTARTAAGLFGTLGNLAAGVMN